MALTDLTLPYQLLLGFALGNAAEPALVPYVQSISNEAWAAHAVRPPDARLLAEGVAQGQVAHDLAYGWAKEQGFDAARMDAMVDVANVGPGASLAFELWRRGLIDQAGFQRALKRMGLEQEWIAALAGLRNPLLSSQELAMMQQQGFIDANRANDEGALQGVTNERQQLRFEASGLPPGIETAFQMLRRGIIGQAEFAQIVREGHTKTKYTDELLALEKQVLSAATYVRLRLKGYIGDAEMHAGGAKTGYTPADLDQWLLSEGRPATAHQIHIGYARGASLPGAANEREAIITSVRESDIKPKYGDIIYAGRATYPSLFQLTRLVEGGTISPATGADWAHKAGLAAEVVTALEQSWSGTGQGAAADAHVAKAQTQLWTTTHRSYVQEESNDAQATSALTAAGVASGSVPQILSLWQHERALIRRQLTPAQIKKAYAEGVTNPATGQPWSHADAVARLVALGMSTNDATTFLEL